MDAEIKEKLEAIWPEVIGAVITKQSEGAVLNYECRLLHHYNVGAFTIIIGEIKTIHTSDKTNLDKIYALGGMHYGAIKEVETLQQGRG